MVSTRNHPTELPPPATPAASNTAAARTPRARSNGAPKSAAAAAAAAPNTPAPATTTATSPAATSTTAAKRAKSPAAKTPRPTSPSGSALSTTKSSSSSSTSSAAGTGAWQHAPTALTLLWLAVSLPLVAWDTGYVLLRPHSMTGGAAHWPVWTPYAVYATVDYVYGLPAWEAHSGFTAAQASLNVLESAMYLVYLDLVLRKGVRGPAGLWKGDVRLRGRDAAVACLIGFATSVSTAAKTVLYGLHEYYSGFSNIGHNSFDRLLFLWIIPNGLWIVFPAYMAYVFGADILRGLDAAATTSSTGRKRH